MFIIEKEFDCKLDDVIWGNIEWFICILIKYYFGVCFFMYFIKINKEIRIYDIYICIDCYWNGKFDVKFNIIFVMKVVFLENLVMMVFYVGDIWVFKSEICCNELKICIMIEF